MQTYNAFDRDIAVVNIFMGKSPATGIILKEIIQHSV